MQVALFSNRVLEKTWEVEKLGKILEFRKNTSKN